MSDLVTSQTNFEGSKRLVKTFTSISDGTGEDDVAKIDISALVKPDGIAPTKVIIRQIWYNVSGMILKIGFNHTSVDYVVALQGHGHFNYKEFGGLIDPASSGGTGDVVFKTVAHSASDSYTVTLDIEFA